MWRFKSQEGFDRKGFRIINRWWRDVFNISWNKQGITIFIKL